MTSGTFSYPSQRNTGYKVTAEDWNELVDDINYIGQMRSIDLMTNITNTNIEPVGVNVPMDLSRETVNNQGTPRLWLGPLFKSVGNNESYAGFSFVTPQDYAGSPMLIFSYYGTSTTGSIVVGVVGVGFSEGGTSRPTSNTRYLGTFAMPGTANHIACATINIGTEMVFQKGKKASMTFINIGTASEHTAGTITYSGFQLGYQL